MTLRILCLPFYLLLQLPAVLMAGELDPAQEKWFEKYSKQENAPDPAEQLLNTDPEPDLSADGFVPLFNGTDLAGWTPLGGDCTFEVEGGEIVGSCVPGSPSTYLSTDRTDFADFVFTCEVRWEVDGNTGIMFRAKTRPHPKNEGQLEVYGPQAEMEDEGKPGRGWSGGIYGQSCGGYWYPVWLTDHAEARAAKKVEGWNRITIECRGEVMKTWLNGVPVGHLVNGEYLEGFFGLQIHSGKQGKVRFRDLRVMELE